MTDRGTEALNKILRISEIKTILKDIPETLPLDFFVQKYFKVLSEIFLKGPFSKKEMIIELMFHLQKQNNLPKGIHFSTKLSPIQASSKK